MKIEYDNTAGDGILIPFGPFELRVYLSCTVDLDAEFKAYTHSEDRQIMGRPGDWEVDFRSMELEAIRMSVAMVGLDGEDAAMLFDNMGDEPVPGLDEYLRMPVDVTNGKEVSLLEYLREVVEVEGPNQCGGGNTQDEWIERFKEAA